jgi:uncharacterized LabA/DUF88 family protein
MGYRANIYIDGQNLHHSLQNVHKYNPRHFKKSYDSYSINYDSFSKMFLKSDSILNEVKYYGAVYPFEFNQDKHDKDKLFHARLKDLYKIDIRLGKFKRNPVREKGVDVLLALDLVLDAIDDKYDNAFVVSDDTDLIPAIEEISRRYGSGEKQKRIYQITLRDKLLNEFKDNCYFCIKIGEDKIKKIVV